MTTIPVPLSDNELEKIDYFVKIGRYKNRSQAIKALLQLGINHIALEFEWEHSEEEESSQRLLKRMLNSSQIPIKITSTKSADEIIGDERSR